MKKEQSYRVLVIDDNPAIHDDFRKILQPEDEAAIEAARARATLFGVQSQDQPKPVFEVITATQGNEGLARLVEARNEGKPFALAFVDVRMPPGWDGVETIQHLWQEDPG